MTTRAFWVLCLIVLVTAVCRAEPNDKKKAAALDKSLKQGGEALRRNDYAAAEEAFTDAIHSDPNSAAAWFGRGIARTPTSMEDAYKDFTQAILINPREKTYYYFRGRLCVLMKRLSQALKDYDFALKLDASYEPAYLHRGMTYCTMGNFLKGIEDFNQAIALKPTDGHAWYARGVANMQLGRKEDSARDLQEAERLGYKPQK